MYQGCHWNGEKVKTTNADQRSEVVERVNSGELWHLNKLVPIQWLSYRQGWINERWRPMSSRGP